MVGLRGNSVDGEVEVVGCDAACDVGGEFRHAFYCLCGCCMLEDDAEVGEVGSEFAQVGEEVLLGVEDGDVLGSARLPRARNYLLVVAWHFTVQVEHHVLLLHSLEDRVVHSVVFNTG